MTYEIVDTVPGGHKRRQQSIGIWPGVAAEAKAHHAQWVHIPDQYTATGSKIRKGLFASFREVGQWEVIMRNTYRTESTSVKGDMYIRYVGPIVDSPVGEDKSEDRTPITFRSTKDGAVRTGYIVFDDGLGATA